MCYGETMTFDQIASYFGGVTKAAKEIKVSRQTVHRWKTHGVPVLQQLHIQKLARGEIRADPKKVSKLRALLEQSAA